MEAVAKLYNGQSKLMLFASAAALRLLLVLFFPGLPDFLTGRVEISTPVNSFKRLQEGLFLYERGLDPYDGGIFHQAPLLLPLFALFSSPSTRIGSIFSVALYTAIDILSADCLYNIAASGAAVASRFCRSPRSARTWMPESVAAVYLFNPYTILSCLGRPSTAFTNLFVLLSIKQATEAKLETSAFALALASYMSIHPAFLLPPIGMLCYDQLCQHRTGNSAQPRGANGTVKAESRIATDKRKWPSANRFALRMSSAFGATILLLFGLSRVLLPSWQFLISVYATPLQLPDLTPNSGLWWYFFVEMFDAFRSFFLGVFWLHMLSYSVPFCLRLKSNPLAAVVAMMGVLAIFEPYANVGDVGTWLSALCLLGHVFELSSLHRYTFPAVATLLYSSLLGPAFHHLWIYAGSGNANFFYAITLVWNLALLILLTDTIYAVLRDEWEMGRPERRDKEVRQI